MYRPNLPNLTARAVVRAVAALGAVALLAGAFVGGAATKATTPAATSSSAITVYVVNKAPQFFSNATIEKDIPAWEQAANKDFAPIWSTPQVRIVLTTRPPRSGIVAEIVKSGPVQGALAYHTVSSGEPKIVDYAGVNDYYGYSNSVSITHELFELLADPETAALNQGYPADNVYLGHQSGLMPSDSYWIQEACDPVEAFAYRVRGTEISDFVTPNWWNDQVAGQYDFMHLIGAPFTVLTGGYAAYEVQGQWSTVTNFHHAGRDASGFLKGEKITDLVR